MYARPIQQLIDALSRLPSVGQRSAERFVFYLLKSGRKDVGELTNALQNLMTQIKSCNECWDFSDNSPCAVCADPARDKKTICVVAEPQDVQALERTGAYKGQYHVLRGLLNPDDERALQYVKINELVSRAKKVEEIILALNPDLRGETTMMYLTRQLAQKVPEVKVTRLARGLPMGSDLQYADDVTLSSALRYRVGS